MPATRTSQEQADNVGPLRFNVSTVVVRHRSGQRKDLLAKVVRSQIACKVHSTAPISPNFIHNFIKLQEFQFIR